MRVSDYKPGDKIELDEYNIILKIPCETARLEVRASFLDDNEEVASVHRTLKLCDIQKARMDFLDNVEAGDDYEAMYCLTDSGRKWLEEYQGTYMEDDGK